MENGKASVQSCTTKQKHFPHYTDEIVRLNNGSFGCCPKSVLDVQSIFRQKFLARPDQYFFSGNLHNELQNALSSITSVFKLGQDLENKLGFTENATVAGCIVARHWGLISGSPKKFLIITDCIYGAFRNTFLEFMPNTTTIELKLLDDGNGERSIPTNKAELLRRFKIEWEKAVGEINTYQNGTTPAQPVEVFLILDYISSQPAILFPVKDMLDHARSSDYHIHTFVDAAQAFLHDKFDLVSEFGDPDFATINLHKWNFSPISVALLYHKSPALQHIIPGWNYGKGFVAESCYTGTRDYGAYLVAPAALEFLRTWRSDEGEIARDYCERNLRIAIEKLAKSWGTMEEYFPSCDVMPPNIAMVKLPSAIPPIPDNLGPGRPGGSASTHLRTVLREQHNIECSVAHFNGMGNYLRLSFAIYNTKEDIDSLEKVISDMTKDWNLRKSECHVKEE